MSGLNGQHRTVFALRLEIQCQIDTAFGVASFLEMLPLRLASGRGAVEALLYLETLVRFTSRSK